MKKPKLKKLLITGGAGFIGSSIAEKLQDKYQIIVLDNFSTGSLENLKGVKCKIIKSDCFWINDKVPEKVDLIFHLGIPSSMGMYRENRRYTGSAVAEAVEVFEKAIKDNARVVIASTSSLYNGLPVPFSEEQEIKPTDFYTEARLAIERIANVYHQLYGLNYVCLRLFSVYGHKERAKKEYANMITKFIWAMKEGKNPIAFSENVVRDFIYIDDVVEAFEIAGKSNVNGVFNIGTGIGYSFGNVVELINKAMGTNFRLKKQKGKAPKNFVWITLADTKKAAKVLGFKAKYSLEEGIKRVLGYGN
jgi:UDP-glucose 4-epimerase